MKSANSYELTDLERDLPTRREDALALRRARQPRRLSFNAYLEFLSHFAPSPASGLRARKNSTGMKSFEL
jgi:hypothetical protein